MSMSDNMPIIYPCFYEEGTNKLLACASQQNPSQRCPENYQRIGESVYCRPVNKSSTTTSSQQVVLTTPRTGGNFQPSPEMIIGIFAILMLSSMWTFFAKSN